MKLRLIVIAILSTLILGILPSSFAAGSSPKLTVKCGQIVGYLGDLGTYGLFAPDISVKYYGSPLVITAYLMPTPTTKKSDASQQIVTFTDKASSTRFFNTKVDLKAKILEWGQPQTGYFKILIEAVDTLKRKGTFTCVYQDYYFSTPEGNPGSLGDFSGLNKTLCTYKNKKLYGSVQIVDYGADFKVQIVDYGQDLKVKEVSYGASYCGVWKIVDYGADFKIKIVDYGADFKIKIVEYGAGF